MQHLTSKSLNEVVDSARNNPGYKAGIFVAARSRVIREEINVFMKCPVDSITRYHRSGQARIEFENGSVIDIMHVVYVSRAVRGQKFHNILVDPDLESSVCDILSALEHSYEGQFVNPLHVLDCSWAGAVLDVTELFK